MKKIALILMALGSLALVIYGFLLNTHHGVQGNILSISGAAIRAHQTDSFQVRFTDTGQLRIRSMIDQSLVYHSLPEQSFLAAQIHDDKEHLEAYLQGGDQDFLCEGMHVDQFHAIGNIVVLEGRLVCEDGSSVGWMLEITEEDAHRVLFTMRFDRQSVEAGWFVGGIKPRELFIGDSQSRESFVLNGALSRGGVTPFVLSSRNRAIALKAKGLSAFDFRSNQKFELILQGRASSFTLYKADTPEALLRFHTRDTGRMRIPEDHLDDGLILSTRWGSARLLASHRKLEQAGVPISMVWVDDWAGYHENGELKSDWRMDQRLYPEWPEVAHALKAEDTDLFIRISPLLSVTPSDVFEGDVQGMVGDRLDQLELGFRERGEPLHRAYRDNLFTQIDLNSELAKEWSRKRVTNLLYDLHVDGVITDVAPIHRSYGHVQEKNQYLNHWVSLLHSAARDRSLQERPTVVVTGFAPAELVHVDLLNTSDIHHQNEELSIKPAIAKMLTNGLRGQTLNHFRIPVSECFQRQNTSASACLSPWFAVSAFMPFFHIEDVSSEYHLADHPEVISELSNWADLFQRLQPYREQLFVEAASWGKPVVRPLFLEDSTERQNYKIGPEQFMLGKDILLFIPDRSDNKPAVYFPKGHWVELETGEIFSKGRRKLSKVNSTIHIFYRRYAWVGPLLEDWQRQYQE